MQTLPMTWPIFSQDNIPRDTAWRHENENDGMIPTLTDIVFTEEDIKDAIDELRKSSASGPDGIAAIFLKKCKLSLAKPL